MDKYIIFYQRITFTQHVPKSALKLYFRQLPNLSYPVWNGNEDLYCALNILFRFPTQAIKQLVQVPTHASYGHVEYNLNRDQSFKSTKRKNCNPTIGSPPIDVFIPLLLHQYSGLRTPLQLRTKSKRRANGRNTTTPLQPS